MAAQSSHSPLKIPLFLGLPLIGLAILLALQGFRPEPQSPRLGTELKPFKSLADFSVAGIPEGLLQREDYGLFRQGRSVGRWTCEVLARSDGGWDYSWNRWLIKNGKRRESNGRIAFDSKLSLLSAAETIAQGGRTVRRRIEQGQESLSIDNQAEGRGPSAPGLVPDARFLLCSLIAAAERRPKELTLLIREPGGDPMSLRLELSEGVRFESSGHKHTGALIRLSGAGRPTEKVWLTQQGRIIQVELGPDILAFAGQPADLNAPKRAPAIFAAKSPLGAVRRYFEGMRQGEGQLVVSVLDAKTLHARALRTMPDLELSAAQFVDYVAARVVAQGPTSADGRLAPLLARGAIKPIVKAWHSGATISVGESRFHLIFRSGGWLIDRLPE